MSEALFGKSKFFLQRYNFSHALDVVNQVVAGKEGFIPGLIEKMKLQLALQDWEQAIETAQRYVPPPAKHCYHSTTAYLTAWTAYCMYSILD